MDSLTQITLGAAVGELTLGRKIGNRAMMWGAVAGTIPDLDVLAGFFMKDVFQVMDVYLKRTAGGISCVFRSGRGSTKIKCQILFGCLLK